MFNPIEYVNKRSLDDDTDLEFIGYENKAGITALLEGHKVVKADDHHLILDDGTILLLPDWEECCAGYDLTELNGIDNIITKVEFLDDPDSEDCPGRHDGPGTYKIFVYAENVKVNLATWEGTDSNGYYGTGYEIVVRRAN